MRRNTDVVRWAAVWLLAGVLFVGAVLRPPTTVRAAGTSLVLNPSTASVNPGESFQVNVVLSTDTPTRGVQFGLMYDASLVQIEQVVTGPFYQSWSDANGGQGAAVMPFQPHNSSGRLSTGAIVLLGGPVDGPTGSGTVLSLQMTARPGASGRSRLLFTDVIVSNTQAESVPDVTWTGAVVGVGLAPGAVGAPPEPVLAAQETPAPPPGPSQPGLLRQIMALPPLNWFVAGLLGGCAGTTAGFWLLGWLRSKPKPASASPDSREYALER